MKIVQQSSGQLKLRLTPVALWIFGGIFAAAGFFIITILCKATTLNCNRTEPAQGSCQLVTSGLLQSEVKEIPLNVLQKAEVAESRSDDGYTYRVTLVTSNGDLPFTSYSSSGEGGKQAIASRINEFVGNPSETSLKVQQDDRLFIFIFGSVFIIVGFFVGVCWGQIVTCQFDKTLGSLILKRKGLFGTQVAEHRIKDIKDVQVQTSTSSDGSTYRVSIVLLAGEHLPVTMYYSSGRESKQKTADCIRKFLSLEN